MAGQLVRNGGAATSPAKAWQSVKRLVDIAGATIALIALGPLMAVIAILIRLDSHGHVLYKSQRMSRVGRPFTLYKFRTMYEGCSARHALDGSLVVDPDDLRLTKVGRYLRRGLDELPQFANVLHGEMSIVGPRADPVEALSSYHPKDYLRLSVRPGITGLAQVSGRTNIPLEQRRDLDLLYVSKWQPRLDFYICLLTIFELVPGLSRLFNRVHHRMQKAMSKLIDK